MAGENLCIGYIEVAFEQWIERERDSFLLCRSFLFLVDFTGVSTVIRRAIYPTSSAFCNECIYMKLGGTAEYSS